jgi:hypothetical protein
MLFGVYSGYGQTPIEYKIAQIQEQIDQKQLAIDLLDGEKIKQLNYIINEITS